MRTPTSSLTLAALIMVLASSAFAQLSISGVVTQVIDGKTVVIAGPTAPITAELQFIDIPANGPLREAVKEHLARFTLGKFVTYRAQTIYGNRTVGRLMLDGADLSMQMLRDGAAWHVPQSISSQEKGEFDSYANVESLAKVDKRGVWADPSLRPTWEAIVAKLEPGTSPQQVTAKSRIPHGYWSDIDPSLGDVGALAHGYNAATKSGYVSTLYLPVAPSDQDNADEGKTAIDVTYLYKYSAGKRSGVFLITVISEAPHWRFLKLNDMAIVGDGTKKAIGKPKRTTESVGSTRREKLTFEANRSAIDKIVNGNEVVIRIGHYNIRPAQGLQLLLYNLLQVAS